MKSQLSLFVTFLLVITLVGCNPQSPVPAATTILAVTDTFVPPTSTPLPTGTSVPTKSSAPVNQTGVVNGNQFCNVTYHIQFSLPENWEKIGDEEFDSGENIYTVYFSTPGFVEEVPPFAEFILSIAVIDVPFELHKAGMQELMGYEVQEDIIIDGRESYHQIGSHEFGGKLNIVLIPDGDNSIEFILRTDEEPYRSEFHELLESISFQNNCTN